MIDPKIFFRKLDQVLTKISQEKADGQFLYSIVSDLETIFGQDLQITNGRIYEQQDDEFVLLEAPVHPNKPAPASRIPLDSTAVRYVLQHGTYIYDDPRVAIDRAILEQQEYAVPAAITVRSPERRWLFVFELKSGWMREEVEFTLNAVRTMLEYRLISESVNNELRRAVQIQESLLPAVSPDFNGFQISGRMQPAELVGGDFFDYIPFDTDTLGITVGDTSGHGLPAALLVRDVVTGLRMGLEKEMKMVYTLKKLNRVIYRSTFSSGFVSLCYGELESNGNFIYVNAGHPAPLYVKGERVIELKASGLIIGAIPEINLRRSYQFVEPESLLVFYSDGIFERENRRGEPFGLDRLKRLIIENQHKTAQQLVSLIFDEVFAFGGNRKWKDDATVVIVKRLQANGEK